MAADLPEHAAGGNSTECQTRLRTFLMMKTDYDYTKRRSAAMFSHLERHVVLVSPEIHWNTGNIGRTCLGTGARLHLIKPLGFSLENRYVKRAGLDYWRHVNVHVWDDFFSFLKQMNPQPEEIFLLTKNGSIPFWSAPSPQKMFLIFGSETKGLPASILAAYPQATYAIPMTSHIRSLNLSTTVGIVLYESYRSWWCSNEIPCRRPSGAGLT